MGARGTQSSVVNRINKGSKLIPVVIDECDVPESLRSTVWQKVDSLDSYDANLQRILAAILMLTTNRQ